MPQQTSTISQKTRTRIYIVIILLVAVLAGFLDYPKIWNSGADWINEKLPVGIPHYPSRDFVLGLDLQGGTHLVYNADVSEIPSGEKGEAVEGVRDVIERRVNAFGVSEPLVQTTKVGSNYRVIVELAGVKDVNQAIDMIGETPLLEFKEQDIEAVRKYNEQAEEKAQEILDELLADPSKFDQYAEEKSEDTVTASQGGDLGVVVEGQRYFEFFEPLSEINKGQIYEELAENGEGYNIIKSGGQAQKEQVKANHILICYQGAARCDADYSQDEAYNKIQELKQQAIPENFVDLAKEHSTEPGASEKGGDLGWFGSGQMVPEFEEAAFALETGQISDIVETQFGYHLIYVNDKRIEDGYQGYRILIAKKQDTGQLGPEDFVYSGLSGSHLDKAQVSFDQMTGEARVVIEFNDEGKELFAQITERNINKPVAIFLDGEPISVPTVREKITAGSAEITGDFSIEEAKTLARRLNAGALPVPIELVSQQTVGASLGQESLILSLEAAILGFILVGLFMLIVYRLPGLTSVLSLIFYGIIILALFKIIPVTLTLAGIAGFILSVGMAVDANVLIFERMKEELRAGKPLGAAIDEGFKRAWPSIRDGNISTLITCVILYWFGTSFIQGFALTLLIGVLISMISALYVTRTFLQIAIRCNLVNKVDWLFLQGKSTEGGEDKVLK